MNDLISRQAVIDTEGLDAQIRCEMCKNPMHTDRGCDGNCKYDEKLYERIMQILGERIKPLPPAQSEIIYCKDCKHWRQNTNYQGVPLSFGFCESDGMWRSLYGETYEVSHIDTDDDFYCGYAERRTDETD